MNKDDIFLQVVEDHPAGKFLGWYRFLIMPQAGDTFYMDNDPDRYYMVNYRVIYDQSVSVVVEKVSETDCDSAV